MNWRQHTLDGKGVIAVMIQSQTRIDSLLKHYKVLMGYFFFYKNKCVPEIAIKIAVILMFHQ